MLELAEKAVEGQPGQREQRKERKGTTAPAGAFPERGGVDNRQRLSAGWNAGAERPWALATGILLLNQDRRRVVSFSLCHIVSVKRLWRVEMKGRCGADEAQERPKTHWPTLAAGYTCLCSAAKGKGDLLKSLLLTPGPSRRSRGDFRKRFSKGLAGTSGFLAEKPTDFEAQLHSSSKTGYICQPPTGAAMDTRR